MYPGLSAEEKNITGNINSELGSSHAKSKVHTSLEVFWKEKKKTQKKTANTSTLWPLIDTQ